MPSRDPVSGKRLTGAQQRRLKEQRTAPTVGGPAHDPPTPTGLYSAITDPPVREGVIAVAEWAVTAVLPTCVALARSGMDLDRVSVVQKSAAKLGKMRDKALRCEQALLVREDRRGTAVDVLAPEPPVHDPIATLAWAYMALAKAIYDMTRDAHFRAKKYTIMTDACAAVGYVPPNSAIDAILDEFDPPRRKGA